MIWVPIKQNKINQISNIRIFISNIRCLLMQGGVKFPHAHIIQSSINLEDTLVRALHKLHEHVTWEVEFRVSDRPYHDSFELSTLLRNTLSRILLWIKHLDCRRGQGHCLGNPNKRYCR